MNIEEQWTNAGNFPFIIIIYLLIDERSWTFGEPSGIEVI